MTHPKKQPGSSRSRQSSHYLYVMVVQRLAEGLGPGPIRVYKKVLREEVVGATVKKVRVPVPLDHQLPAGTGALTSSDRKAFAEQGLSVTQIAYVESKLQAKKAASDAHKAAFEAGKTRRLRETLKMRLIAQLSADPLLASEVMSAVTAAAACELHEPLPSERRPTTLSEKVRRLLSLMAEVSEDIEAYKDGAKVGKTFDQYKLRAMFNRDAEQAWKLSWFAFSQMIDQAKSTPFARPKGWFSNQVLSKLAADHGYRSGRAADDSRDVDE